MILLYIHELYMNTINKINNIKMRSVFNNNKVRRIGHNKTSVKNDIGYDYDQDEDESNGKNVMTELLKGLGLTGMEDDLDSKVFRNENHMYFRSDVDDNSVSKLIDMIDEYNREQDNIQNILTGNYCFRKPIYLFITSHGGDLYQGLLAHDHIKNSSTPIYTVASGYAISSGSLMFMAGKRRFMTENSFVLIHQLASYFHSPTRKTYANMTDHVCNDITLMNRLYKIYLTGTRYSYSPVPKKNILTKKILEEHMAHDIFWSYDTCFKYGIVDEIFTNFKDRIEQDLLVFLEKTKLDFKQPRMTFTEKDFEPSQDIIDKVKSSGKNYQNGLVGIIADQLKGKKFIMEGEEDLDEMVDDKFVQSSKTNSKGVEKKSRKRSRET